MHCCLEPGLCGARHHCAWHEWLALANPSSEPKGNGNWEMEKFLLLVSGAFSRVVETHAKRWD